MCDEQASVAVNTASLSVSKMRPLPSPSYGFMQKMKEEEVEWVYMREPGEPMSIPKIKSRMSNGGVERAARRMEPRDGGGVIRAGVGRMVGRREGGEKRSPENGEDCWAFDPWGV